MQSQHTTLNAVYFSRNLKNETGHGGTRRTFQMIDTIANYHPKFVSTLQKDFMDESLSLFGIPIKNFQWNDLTLKNIITDGEYGQWSEKFRNNIVSCRIFAHKWAGIITTKLPTGIAFVEEPLFFAPLIDRLQELNIPVIGLEQNIETHVSGQVREKHQHELFKKEIEYFKKCDLVITISHEDTVVLNNYGVNTIFLPYYPAQEQRRLFLNVRENRVNHQNKKDYIMLGTAGNIPTLEGMIDFIRQWAASAELKDITLYVVGYGTEKIEEQVGKFLAENIKILGGVNDERLHALLNQVKASIIFQTNSTGALTKITELLIAGVPVYANYHAARSYHHVKGVMEYHDFRDLIDILIEDKSAERMIDIPVPEPPQNDFVLRTIDNVIRLKKSSPKPRPEKKINNTFLSSHHLDIKIALLFVRFKHALLRRAKKIFHKFKQLI